MHPRLIKEYRALVLPWTIGVVAALAALAAPHDWPFTVFSFGCAGVLAAMVFGSEFQHRTLPLLLTQPRSRKEIWNDKLGVAAFGAGTLAVLDSGVQGLLAGTPPLAVLTVVVVLLTVAGAYGIFPATRSLPLSLLLGVIVPLLLFAALAAVFRNWSGFPLRDFEPELCLVLSAAGACYCAILAYFGFRPHIKSSEFCWRPFLIVLLFAAGWVLSRNFPRDITPPLETAIRLLFMVNIVCSAGLWTLLARTTVGGLVFTIGGQVVLAIVLSLLDQRLQPPFDYLYTAGAGFWTVAVLVDFVYAALCLWLGWKVFARFEWREGSSTNNFMPVGQKSSRSWVLSWLCCRSRGVWLNLVRKELHLHGPVFLVAGVFSTCWAIAWLAMLLRPQPWLSLLFVWLLCIYIPVALLLAGTVSLGDERTLGLASWHLTLPIPAWQSWLVKLATAASTGTVLGLLLPAVLFTFTPHAPGIRFSEVDVRSSWNAFAAIGAAFFLLGFWAAGFTGNTIRAALIVLAGMAGAFGCVMLATDLEHRYYLTGGLASVFLELFGTTDFPADFSNGLWFATSGLGIAAVVFVILIQSLAQFRRDEVQPRSILYHALILAVVVVVAAFWCGDMAPASSTLNSTR